MINYLCDNGYKLVIATNGPIVPLKSKIEKLGIADCIDTIFSAEEVGYMKPNKAFYEGLLKKAKLTNLKDTLFIGDDLEKDVKGAIENKIDICWCNYDDAINDKYKINYEINNLKELKDIL